MFIMSIMNDFSTAKYKYTCRPKSKKIIEMGFFPSWHSILGNKMKNEKMAESKTGTANGIKFLSFRLYFFLFWEGNFNIIAFRLNV